MRRGLIAGAALVLGGCATSSLVLMPDDEGHQGSVAVLEANGKPADAVISERSRTRLGDATPTSKPLGAGGLKKQEAALLTDLPPAAKSFLLYFDPGTVNLVPSSSSVLANLRAEIAARSGPEVEVIGHTDTIGSEADNDKLSVRRAQQVMEWLATQGFDRSEMSAVGRGERDLMVATGDNIDNAVNRRVEVIVR